MGKRDYFFGLYGVLLGAGICILLLPSILSEGGFAAVVLTEAQKQQLVIAGRAICDTDPDTCDTLQTVPIHYTGLKMPYFMYWMPPEKLRRAYTHKDTDPIEIRFTQHVFDDTAAVTMMLYHELQHVRYSDHTLYDGAHVYEACRDHNRVKQVAQTHAGKLDAWFLSPKGQKIAYQALPGHYANDAGNTLEDCGKEGSAKKS